MSRQIGSLSALDDKEGTQIPGSLPTVIDAHVHLFPDELFAAIWAWFDKFAWPIRYKLDSQGVIEFLLSRGIDRIVGLHYAHRPGIARHLNRYMASLCKSCPQLIGTATIFPGEKADRDILEEAFQMGLAGVKLHSHVQFFSMDSPEMHEIYEICSEYQKPLIMHVGREPKSPVFNYKTDPYEICGADKVEPVLKGYPNLNVIVPHLGADEYAAFAKLIHDYDNLWLDIAMVLADYLPQTNPPKLSEMRSDRVLYGTDFPHLPYAWDRELKRLCALGLSESDLAMVLGGNALSLFLDSRE
ncbi:MAG: amidohydrolase [Desulfomonile tiedjei]|uniref:Amidohydrolase n=1 Tax=Desulfomonile tiedjei TaxID=2358 RepID=A0A9D6V3L8_9BACT|nr:amidohydrolase [Desulfomonile tiedjei]